MKHKNMLLVSLLMASLVLLGGCQSRTLTTQDPELTVGESVVEPDPEPVQPVEQEPQIPDDAPGFYTTRQEMNGWEVFSLSTAQDLIDLSDWVQGGEDTSQRIFVLEDNIDLGGVDLVPTVRGKIPSGAPSRPGVQHYRLERTVPDYGAPAGLFGHRATRRSTACRSAAPSPPAIGRADWWAMRKAPPSKTAPSPAASTGC